MKRAILIGAFVGLSLSIALSAVFYLAAQVFDLPFIPFDVLDWFARIEQLGGAITFGIDTLIAIITAFGGQLSTAAKPAEQIMAVSGLLVTGAAAGAAMFAVLRRRAEASGARAGLLVSAVLGVPVTLISHSLNQPDVMGLIINTAWILGAFLVWGAGLGWAYEKAGAPATRDVSEAETQVTSEMPAEKPRPTVEMIDRRSFLIRLGGATAVITVVGAGLGALVASERARLRRQLLAEAAGVTLPENLPNADDPLIPAPGTRPEYTPLEDHYRIDINALPREIDGETWRLNITGMVDKPVSLTLDTIRAYPSMDQYITLACISNPIAGDLISTTRWTGVSLQRVLADLGVQDGARVLNIRSADGFHEAVSLDIINRDERVMLTYAWDGQPLLSEHGFPLRIYIPDRYGMKQPKWITDIEVSDIEQEGYWVRRGWDPVAQMLATSVIDTVAAESLVEEGGQTLVPIGGIAHTGARGVSKVEVQVDDGEWVEAALRAPLSETTWVIWRYDWPFAEGRHTFRVRCYEGDGTLQLETRQGGGGRLGGAVGIHTRRETV